MRIAINTINNAQKVYEYDLDVNFYVQNAAQLLVAQNMIDAL